MILINNLTKRFKKHTVLNDVSLEFKQGTATAVIGPNGSGKTTLMKCILGLVTPNAGSIMVDGNNSIEDAFYRRNIGYMAQIARYPENLSAMEIIAMIRELRSDSARNDAEILIDSFELRPHLDKPMRSLSGGTRQKVGAVIALMFNPSALLLDEPTAGLDPITSQRLKDRIAAARNNGTTVLITSHILSEIQELADCVVYLFEGKVLFQGETQQLMREHSTDNLQHAITALMDLHRKHQVQ